MIQTFLNRRVLGPVLQLLRQGITPEKIALSIAFGIVLGVFPALGWTTLLGLAAAVVWELNPAAVQLVNFLVYPLQLALLIPFMHAGEVLFRAPRLALSVPRILAMIHAGVWDAIKALWTVTVHAITVWALIAPLGVLAIYWMLLPLLRRFSRAPAFIDTTPTPRTMASC